MDIRFNLLDALCLLLIIRTVIIGQKSSFLNEVFKLVSIYFATVFGLHYYMSFGSWLGSAIWVPVVYQPVAGFFGIIFLINLIYPIIRKGWTFILDIDRRLDVSVWVCGLLSSVRAYLMCGLLILGLLVSNTAILNETAKGSFSYLIFKRVSADIYRMSFEAFIKPVFSTEELNEKVFSAIRRSEIDDKETIQEAVEEDGNFISDFLKDSTEKAVKEVTEEAMEENSDGILDILK